MTRFNTQQELEKHLTAHNKRMSERYHRNDKLQLSKKEGKSLNIEARGRILKQTK